MFAFLTAALLSALATVIVLHRMAGRYRWNLTALALGYGAGFVGVLAVVRVMG